MRFDSSSVPMNGTTLLVSCCNANGGLYILRFEEGQHVYDKFLQGDIRGIAHCDSGFIVVNNDHGIYRLDTALKIVAKYQTHTQDYHGAAVYDNQVYVVETKDNTIGIFDVDTLERVDEICLAEKGKDILHMNDLCVHQGVLYLTMFSQKMPWREHRGQKGLLVRIPLIDRTAVEIIAHNLRNPHSIRFFENEPHWCNSSEFNVIKNHVLLFDGIGYTRGLEKIGDVMFIGQSKSRNLELMQTKKVVSLDAGVTVWDMKRQVSKFFALPSDEVYGILNCMGKVNSKVVAENTIQPHQGISVMKRLWNKVFS